MSNPYVGEIRLFAGNFPPQDWMTCDGQLLPISQFETLFNLIGTTYGGDGQSTFALPNLGARVPVHMGSNGISNYVQGQSGGASSVTLTSNQMPAHRHTPMAEATPASAGAGAAGNWLAQSSSPLYDVSAPATLLAAQSIGPSGGSQPHDNMAPYGVLTYIISLFGIYPSQA